MRNHYLFDEAPVRIWLKPTTNKTESSLKVFLAKYPEMGERIEVLDNELFFLISEKTYISEQDWTVDFLESNIDGGRLSNGEGNDLAPEFYEYLFDLFEEDGSVYFETGNDFCAMETAGSFNCRYHFRLTRNGLSWEEDD